MAARGAFGPLVMVVTIFMLYEELATFAFSIWEMNQGAFIILDQRAGYSSYQDPITIIGIIGVDLEIAAFLFWIPFRIYLSAGKIHWGCVSKIVNVTLLVAIVFGSACALVGGVSILIPATQPDRRLNMIDDSWKVFSRSGPISSDGETREFESKEFGLFSSFATMLCYDQFGPLENNQTATLDAFLAHRSSFFLSCPHGEPTTSLAKGLATVDGCRLADGMTVRDIMKSCTYSWNGGFSSSFYGSLEQFVYARFLLEGAILPWALIGGSYIVRLLARHHASAEFHNVCLCSSGKNYEVTV